MKQSLMASASSFAHLLGRGPKGARIEEDNHREDDDKQRDGESDEDYAKRMDEKKEKEDEARKAEEQKREDEAAARRAEGEDDDDEGDDESDGADMRKKGASSARLRERARCAGIFADKAAGSNPALAATLAFGTDLPRSQAISVLRAGGATAAPQRRMSLDERMAAVRTPVVGASDPAGAPDGPKGLAARIIAAGKKRRGEI